MSLKYTKIYQSDGKIHSLLGTKLISGYGEYTFDNFKGSLIRTLDYIKQDNKKAILTLYDKIFEKETDDIDYAYEKIVNFINEKAILAEKDTLYSIYDIIKKVLANGKKLSEISDLSSIGFYRLTERSKKKLLRTLLKEKYPQKENEDFQLYKLRLKKIIKELADLTEDGDEILINMRNLGMDELFYNIGLTFAKSGDNPINNLAYDGRITSEYRNIIFKYLKEGGVSDKKINRLRQAFQLKQEVGTTLIKQNTEKVDGEQIDKIGTIDKVKRKTIADFNPFLLELGFETGVKVLGYNRFIEIYNNIFSKISYDLLDKTGGKKPSFNSLLRLDYNKLLNKKETEKKDFIAQYIIEFDLENNLLLDELKQLAVLLNEEIGGINLVSPEIDKSFKHLVSTIDGKVFYSGYFADSGEGFADDNILLLQGENGIKKLRLSLSNFSQDEYIYLITQIGYFLANKKFLDKNQLYFNIYNLYNQTLFKTDLFDITILKEQYEKFLENIIIPLSKEGLKLNLKASNILLAGPYGTSKSQFLQHLLLNKKWKYYNKEFNFNAVTIPLGVQEFEALLMQGIGGIKTRLDQIFQRTSTPIVLLIEDLDTLINEKAFGVNDKVAQAMTLFFEGLGSLPVNVVTTSNDPTKFSERLIRPNRISEIFIFFRPNIEEKKKMLQEHLRRSNLSISDDLLLIIYNHNVFVKGTAAHIGEIVKKIKDKLLIKQNILGENVSINKIFLEEILDSINVSVLDLEEQEKKIKAWYEAISGKSETSKIGFN